MVRKGLAKEARISALFHHQLEAEDHNDDGDVEFVQNNDGQNKNKKNVI
jgi:hypothetical protein